MPAPGWLSPGQRVYAIGDVHGCADRLLALHRQIERDIAGSPVEQGLEVHLGDYIDRGPDSAKVIRRLVGLTSLAGMAVVNLRGNHEQMMLDTLRDGDGAATHWLRNGGDATLASWGVAPDGPAAWPGAIAPAELAFLQTLPLYHRVDGYVFVHAGLRPGLPLRAQSAEDMLWIRDGFLDYLGAILPEAPEVGVVHGHTPALRPNRGGRRLGIDTGAAMGGVLTCAVLEGQGVRFMVA